MSKALTEQINLLFEAVKDLENLEEIKPHCDRLNTWLKENTNYSDKSLGTVLSPIPVNEILKLRQTLTKKGLQAFCGMLGSKYYPTSQQFLFFNKRFGFVFSV